MIEAPEVRIKPHWQKLELPFEIGSGRTLYPKVGIRMAFFASTKDASVEGKVWFGGDMTGPPGFVHGGISAFVLDECMGAVAWHNYYACVAQSISIDFVEMSPVQKDLDIFAKIDSVETKKLMISATIECQEKTLSKATGTFYRLSKEKMADFAKKNTNNYNFDLLK